MSKTTKKLASIICLCFCLCPIFLGYLSIDVGSVSGATGLLDTIQTVVSSLKLSGASSSVGAIQRQVGYIEDGSFTLIELIDFGYTCSSSLDDIVSSGQSAMDTAGGVLGGLESFTGGLTSGLTDSYNDALSSLVSLQWKLRFFFIFPALMVGVIGISVFAGIVANPKKTAMPLICNVMLLGFGLYCCGNMPFASDSHEISISIWMFLSLIASVAYMFIAAIAPKPKYGTQYDSGYSARNSRERSAPRNSGRRDYAPRDSGRRDSAPRNSGRRDSAPREPQQPRGNVQRSAATPEPSVAKDMYCVACGKKQGFGDFCIGCGRNVATPPPEKLFCSKCAKPRSDSQFCPYCGVNYGDHVGETVAETAVAPPPPPEGLCQNCGATGNEGDFCVKCGTKLWKGE